MIVASLPAHRLRNLTRLMLAVGGLLSLGVGGWGEETERTTPPDSRGADDQAVSAAEVARLPVKEITVFKDGHAFVLHQGRLPTDEHGHVHLDYLPTPVIGTFWPYSAESGVRLTAVTAARQRVAIERTALEIRELLEGNVGAKVQIREGDRSYAATIIDLPTRSAQELEATSPPGSGPQLPQKGPVILLQTSEGTRVVPLDAIREVIFVDPPKRTTAQEEFRNLLTLQLAWPEGRPQPTAEVGMTYLQKGIRWIPHYQISIDDDGKARVQLQATLLNELTDLEGVTAHLVIGVPTFEFKGTPDPIALSEAAAQLSQYFQESSQTAYAFSNAMMTQVARMNEVPTPSPQGAVDLGPEIADQAANEDLYLFTVTGLTLKKGERMVVRVAEFELPYRDLYTLSLPYLPPTELQEQLRGQNATQQQAEMARLLRAPKVMHKLRLENTAEAPLTTAPALILKGGKILGQGMLTYTPSGGSVDLPVTAAVNVTVKRSERETGRTPNAANFGGNPYDRVELAGSVELTHLGREAMTVEVERYVLGTFDSVEADGEAVRLDAREDYLSNASWPAWWSWYPWPAWWHHLNGTSRATWRVELEPGQRVELPYTWHYFWRW